MMVGNGRRDFYHEEYDVGFVDKSEPLVFLRAHRGSYGSFRCHSPVKHIDIPIIYR